MSIGLLSKAVRYRASSTVGVASPVQKVPEDHTRIVDADGSEVLARPRVDHALRGRWELMRQLPAEVDLLAETERASAFVRIPCCRGAAPLVGEAAVKVKPGIVRVEQL
jgi:hypothetical protein